MSEYSRCQDCCASVCECTARQVISAALKRNPKLTIHDFDEALKEVVVEALHLASGHVIIRIRGEEKYYQGKDEQEAVTALTEDQPGRLNFRWTIKRKQTQA